MHLRFGLLAQLAERGANNAKVVSSILTQAKLLISQRQQIFNNDLQNMQVFLHDTVGHFQNVSLFFPEQ